MQTIAIILTAVISYLLGSLNSSIITVRLMKGEDIREKGSKNAGLTNTLRCYGKVPALFTLIGDLAKGIIAVLLSQLVCRMLMGEDYSSTHFIDSQAIGYIAGFFAIIGHIFPVYYGFKGGKGVLVASSVLIVIDPVTFAIVIPFFILVIIITKYVSVGSISAAVAYPVITFCVNYFLRSDTLEKSLLYTALTVGTGILLIYMHRTNIARLKAGTENKFSVKKTKSDQ